VVNRKSNLYWFAVALVLACAAPNQFDLLVGQATLRWEKAICRTPPYGKVQLVERIPECRDVPNTWGCHYSISGDIKISRQAPTDQWYKVLVHEMGHSFRPGSHLETPTGVMYQHPNQVPNVITSDDITYICKEYVCPCRNPEKP
jgi:hypothetical protein